MYALLAKAAASTAALLGSASGIIAFELSSVPGIVTVVVSALAGVSAIAGVIFGVKYKVVAQAAEALAQVQGERVTAANAQRDDVLRRLDETRVTLEETRVALIEAQKTIARLEALPNLERVLELVGSTFERLGVDMHKLADRNDQNAAARHDQMLAAIGTLTASLKGAT